MGEHKATIRWEYSGEDFMRGRYSREHTWEFDGGISINASPAPSVVPVPFSNPAFVDPEEAFVASVASCHMLTFLYVASKAGFHVTRYVDEAVGRMTKNEKGVLWVSSVQLNPRIEYHSDSCPSADQIAHLHHDAHEQCFIANSVKTEITVKSD